MWQFLARFFGSGILALDTIDAAVKTANNLMTTAEAHSASFKEISTIELEAKRKLALIEAKKKLAAATAQP